MSVIRSRVATVAFAVVVLALCPGVALAQAEPTDAAELTAVTDLCVTVASVPGVDVVTVASLQSAVLDGTARISDVSLCPSEAVEPSPEPAVEAAPKPGSFRTLNARGWAKLVKDPDRYTGKRSRIYGCIFQFDGATGPDAFLAEASFRRERYWYLDGENASFIGDEAMLDEFVEDDIVRMDVTSLGSYSYDTQAGGNTTVPAFEVVRIRRERGSC